jgi:hypothetical protein
MVNSNQGKMNYPEYFSGDPAGKDGDKDKLNFPEYFSTDSGGPNKTNFPEYFAPQTQTPKAEEKLPWYGKEPEVYKHKTQPSPEVLANQPTDLDLRSNTVLSDFASGVGDDLVNIAKTPVNVAAGLSRGTGREIGLAGKVLNKMAQIPGTGVPAYMARPETILGAEKIGGKLGTAADSMAKYGATGAIGDVASGIGEAIPGLAKYVATAGFGPANFTIWGGIDGLLNAAESGDSEALAFIKGAAKGALMDVVFRGAHKLAPKSLLGRMAATGTGFVGGDIAARGVEAVTGGDRFALPTPTEAAKTFVTGMAVAGLTSIGNKNSNTKTRELDEKIIKSMEDNLNRPQEPTPQPEPKTEIPQAEPTPAQPWDVKSLIDRAKQYGIAVPDEITKKYMPEVAQAEPTAPVKLEAAKAGTVISQSPTPKDTMESWKTDKFGGKQKVTDPAKANADPEQLAVHGDTGISIEAGTRLPGAGSFIVGGRGQTTNYAKDVDTPELSGGQYKAEVTVNPKTNRYEGKIVLNKESVPGSAELELKKYLGELNKDSGRSEPTTPATVITQTPVGREPQTADNRFYVGRKVVVRAPDARNKSDYAGEIVSAGMDWYGVKLNKDGSIKKVKADQMMTHNEYNGRDYYDNMPPEAVKELKRRNKQIDETLWTDMPDIGMATDAEYKDFNVAQSKVEKTNLILKFMAERAGINTQEVNLKDPTQRVQIFDDLMAAITEGRLSRVKESDAVVKLSGTVDDPFSASQGVKKDWAALQRGIRESEKNWGISKETLKDVGQVVELFNKFIEKAKVAKATPITTESDEQFSMHPPEQKPYTPERPPVGIDLPELVQLTKELSGKFPGVKEKIKAGGVGTAQGSFSQSQKRISIEAALGSNTPEARSTLGHEVGHLVDYLAEKFPNTLKRGNLLGHIAAMKDYMRGMLPEFPGAEGELTPADKFYIRGEAIRQAAKEAEGKEVKVDPKEILDVWNSVDARAKDPTLYDYVARLGKQKKIDLIKSAINGIFPDWFTFKKNYGAASKTEKQFYDELIVKEIKKRGLYDLETMKAEAYALSKEWRPFNEKADAKYTVYRKKSSELYADMFSVLVNDPKLIEAKAPNFYKAFWAYLEERPEVKKSYEEMLGKINTGEHKSDLEKRTFDMFKHGDKVREEIAKRSSLRGSLKENLRSAWGQAATYLEPLLHYQKIAKDINPMADLKGARYALERLLYTNSETDAMLRGFNTEVMEPLKKSGITLETFRYYSLLNEVQSKTSPQKFTALGWTPERATESLAKLEATMGSQKFALMMESKRKMFANVLKKFVLDNPEFEQVYGKELTDMFKSRPDYVTHSSIEHLEKMVGAQAGGASTGKIFKRVGSFGEIEDPISATLMKYQSLIRSVRRNVAANELKTGLENSLPDKVSEKKGGALDSEISYMRDGKLQTFFVEAPIARMFEKNPLESNGITRIMGTLASPFKAAFTTYNLGFYLTNPIRDYSRTTTNVKGMTLTNFAKYWFGSIPEARRFVKGRGNTPNVDRMFSKNMITSTVNKGWDAGDMETVRLLKKYDIGHHKNVIKRFFEGMTNVLKVQEITTKVAGEKWLRERRPGMSEAERGHIVRTQVGTPDTLMRGDIGAFLNSAMLYYNVNMQGWRGNMEAAKDHPADWAWKQVKYSVAPKIIMAAAAAGLMGDDVKKIMAGFSNYLKQNFHIIPLGLTKAGKSVGLTIPMDETQRIIGGLTDMAMNKLFGNNDGLTLDDAVKFIEGQTMPGPNPMISLVGDTLKYIYGEPITDNFRGNQALSDREMAAGGMRSLEKFGKYEFTKFFSVIKKFQASTPNEVHGELEKILGLPIIGNPISRFIRVTDFGISEKLSAAQAKVKQQAANKSLDLDAAVKEKIAAGVKSKSEIMATYRQFMNDGIIDKETTRYQIEKKFKRLTRGETPLERQLIYSVSNDEKTAVINRAKDLMNKNELNKLLRDYFEEGLINREVYLKVK